MTRRWQSRDRRQAPGRLLLLLGITLAVIIGIVLIFTSSSDEEVDTVDPADLAFVEAWSRVDASLALSREFVESGEAEAQLVAEAEDAALTAMWEEGHATVIAGELEPNQSIFLALQTRQIPNSSIHFAVIAMGEEFNFRRSRPGDQFRAEVDDQGRITELRYQTSPENIWITTREGQGVYSTEKLDIDVEVRTQSIAGTIDSSLWLAIEATGESGVLAHRLMTVFQYVIDFNVETREGDHFAMIFERIYLDGEFLRYGRVLAAHYAGALANHRAFYFEGENEQGYFAEDGDSLQRQFLRSPLEVTRVTSRFGRRVHPITGNTRMHQGVDYGAPVGTRVQAVADGTVAFAGWRGGYGNLLILRHSGGYETRYAHLHRFGQGIRAGVRVRQGQIVALTGNTGNTTGPHLHYEMLQNGRHIDPLRVDTTRGDPLRGTDLTNFRAHVSQISEELNQALAEGAPGALERLVAREDDSPAE